MKRRKAPYPRLVWERNKPARRVPTHKRPLKEYIIPANGGKGYGRIIQGDNLSAMELLVDEGYTGKIKLVYMDPPFLSDARYYRKIRLKKGLFIKEETYPDTGDMCSYLDMLKERFLMARELLREDGIIFVHCDWRANSYIRVLMDEIFGHTNFLNEIIWHYGGRGAKHVSAQFPRNHDTIYVYRKSKRGSLKKIHTERLIPLKEALCLGYRMDEKGRVFKTAPRGDYTEESIKRLATEDRVYITKNGNVRIKYFLEVREGFVVERPLLGDVWTDIPDAMHTPYEERTGYTTQKPLKLMERIIECSTDAGDLVLDPFCGSGTTAVAAERLGRRWIVCEKTLQGVSVTRKRLLAAGSGPFVIERLEEKPAPQDHTPFLLPPAIEELDREHLKVSIGLNGNMGTLPEGLSEKEAHLLVDYWAIDWNHDGKAFRTDWLSFRNERGKEIKPVEKMATGVIKKKTEQIAVKVVDVFGNETTCVINLKETL